MLRRSIIKMKNNSVYIGERNDILLYLFLKSLGRLFKWKIEGHDVI